jgi:D-lyxose ketol-isomerase
MYHRFHAEKGKGKVLLGEVSMVNDDARDNRFLEMVGRFARIDEDAAPEFLLCSDYDRFFP